MRSSSIITLILVLVFLLPLVSYAQKSGKKKIEGKEYNVITRKEKRQAKQVAKEWEKHGWKSKGLTMRMVADKYVKMAHATDDNGLPKWKICDVEWAANVLLAAHDAADYAGANQMVKWLQREIISYEQGDLNTKAMDDAALAKYINVSTSLAKKAIGQYQEVAYLTQMEGKRYRVRLILAYNYNYSMDKMLEIMRKESENEELRKKLNLMDELGLKKHLISQPNVLSASPAE